MKGQKGLMCAVKPHMGRPNGTFLRQADLLFLSSSVAKPQAGVASSPLQVGKDPESRI